MIGKLTGIIAEKQAPDLLLDVQGVGYELQLSMNSFYALPKAGEQVALYTHFVVREDAQLLYGFATRKERSLFRLLIKANGVGPKLALAILSGLSADQFVQCVQHNDSSTLVKLPGIGKKTAERLIVEMRDRFKDWGNDLALPFELSASPCAEQAFSAPSASDDAISALIALGYNQSQAQKAVKQVAKPESSSEQLIKDALKAML